MKQLILIFSLIFSTTIGFGQIVASDSASNYGTWTNTSNAGMGFGNWDMWNNGTSGHFLNSSTPTHGDINSDNGGGGIAFGMYGNSGANYANAQRGFNYNIAATTYTELQNGHTFSIELATAYRSGNKGIDIFQADFTQLFNLNIGWNATLGMDDYMIDGVSLGWNYDQFSVILVEVTQVSNTSILVKFTRGTDTYGPVSMTTTGRVGYFKCYVGDTGNNDAENNFYFNNMQIRTDNPLPVELKSFNGIVRNNEIFLNWVTLSEENNAGFEIQKSIDGKDFEKIGFVAGNGNSLEEIQYQFIDDEPNFGTNYYRLKQMDFDGNFEFTDIINIDFEKELQVDIFPNPTREKLTIQSDFSENAKVELINISGQIIYQNNINNKALEIDLSAFANGVYLLKITKGTSTILNQKVVKF